MLRGRGWIPEVHLRHNSSCKGQGLHQYCLYNPCHQLYCILRAQSIGSANLDPLPPRSPRLSVTTNPNYSPSAQGYYTYNTSTPPATRVRRSHAQMTEPAVPQTGSSSTLDPTVMMPPPPATQWKRKLSQTMKHLVVSPRFHRKRYDGSPLESPTDVPVTASPQL
jgi:hypothetical protein